MGQLHAGLGFIVILPEHECGEPREEHALDCSEHHEQDEHGDQSLDKGEAPLGAEAGSQTSHETSPVPVIWISRCWLWLHSNNRRCGWGHSNWESGQYWWAVSCTCRLCSFRDECRHTPGRLHLWDRGPRPSLPASSHLPSLPPRLGR